MSIYLPGNNCSLEDLEPFFDIDVIITDIDGTVVSGEAPVIQQIKKTIRRLQKQGINVSIATGRTYFGAKQIIKDLGIQRGMAIALYNGGVIIENETDNMLYSSTFSGVDLIPILKKVNEFGGSIQMYSCETNRNAFRYSDNDHFIEKVFSTEVSKGKYDINGMTVQEISVNDVINSSFVSALIKNDELEKEIVLEIKEYIRRNESLDCTDSGNGYIEIRGRNTNKGILIKKMKEQAQYQSKRILAIGDNDNDLELFSVVDISVAVANSSLSAVEEADYICKRDSAEGFLDMLYTIKNARRYLGG